MPVIQESHLPQPSFEQRLGAVTLDPPGPVVAGSTGTWTITLTVGSMGIDEGGTIKVAQRFASDWEPSQFDRPAASGYTTVTTTGEAKLRPRYDRKGHDRPWMQCIVIDVYDGSLFPGDAVTIILGDRSQGSPGIRAQTFIESKHEFRVFVDPTNACVARAIANSPTFPIIAGETIRLVCIASDDVFVKGEDVWGNPTKAPSDVSVTRDGDAYIASSARLQLTARSNPAPNRDGRFKKYWGDLHAQSDATVGTGTEEEYFRFGRDWARLDFISHQGNDFQVTDEDWKRLNDQVRAFHKDHEYVVFPGWEWSGATPAGGDRNVIFLEEDQPIWRSSHWQVPHIPETDSSPALDAGELFKRVRNHRPDITLLASHVGGRYADIRKYFDQDLGPLVELVSCWGVFEWMLWDAFDMNYIVGVMCNSDGHKGRPGAEGPGAGQFGIPNGLTCALATEKTRAAIFNALKNRRCYGTTGARIDLTFECNGNPMGSLINSATPMQLAAWVKGAAPIESLELFEGKKIIQTLRPHAFNNLATSPHIRLRWRGSRIRGRARRVTWDGSITVEGPKIRSASGYFDTPIDRITHQTDHEIHFISQTTGDADGVDLVLDRPGPGAIRFQSKAGNCEVSLADLTDANPRKIFDFGGLDMQVQIERYPSNLVETSATLESTVTPPAGKMTPYFVKVTQCDGHMAWSSPIYISR
jgi:peroxiredoxin